MSYEGFRSILSFLVQRAGGTGVALGEVIGVGEAVNWILRLATGFLADALGAYWALTGLGYLLTPLGILVAVSAPRLDLIALGVGLERLGKAIRSPARDALIAGMTERHGAVFGAHELLDQIGAVAGPLVAYYLLISGSPLELLALPGAATIATLLAAKTLYPYRPRPTGKYSLSLQGLREGGKIALVSALTSITLVHPVVLVYAGTRLYAMGEQAVILYMAVMLVDAIAALPLGLLWDKYHDKTLLLIPVAGLLGAAAMFTDPWASAVLSGIALAGTETLLKAYTAKETAESMARGTGYGAMALGVGVGLTASGILYSILVDIASP